MKPIVKVCDIETSISWYEDFLDFKCIYKSSIKDPDYVVLENEHGELLLAQDPEKKSYASNLFLIEVSNINKAYEYVQVKGCIIKQPIEEGFFGGKQFIIKDYEDNKIIYKQKA
ncbi:hypothetical protein NBRC116493_07390 [Aurantivibrio infirmus]